MSSYANKVLIEKGIYIMTTKTKRKLKRLIKGIYRNYKCQAYGVALMIFSILPAIMTEDHSWLTIGVVLCIAMIFANDEEEY